MHDSNHPAKYLIWMALLAGLAGMTGCSLLGGHSGYPERYTLDVPAANTGPSAGTPRFDATIALRPVGAPDWLDAKRMLYRLEYTNDHALAAYTRSAWAATPAQLVSANLDGILSQQNLFAAVLGDDSPGHADLALQLELTDFSQHFSSEANSRARIAAKATALRTDNGQVIAQQRFATTAPAPSADAAGGVKALAKADSRLNQQITQWLIQSVQACRPGCTAAGPE